MKLPNAENAVIEIAKLRAYCLILSMRAASTRRAYSRLHLA